MKFCVNPFDLYLQFNVKKAILLIDSSDEDFTVISSVEIKE
jgi:hypothetical protein